MIAANPTPGGLARVCPDFVGREDLLALAGRRWQRALDGSGHVLLLGGEAGIGKSRLLDEMVGGLRAARTVQVHAYPSDRETPGVLLLELAAELRSAGAADAAARIRELVLDDGMVGDSGRRRRLLVADLTAVLHDVLASSMLVRVEDVHWADELSLEVLERLADGLRNQPSMAILTYRSDELYPQSEFQLWRTRLLGQRRAEEVRLARLDEEGTARMFASIIGREPASDERERLYQVSDGIPLHIEEVVAGGFDEVPDTIAETVIDRTVRLRPRTRELLASAAVLGRSFDADLLSRVSGDSPVEVELMLDELIAEHFVVARDDGRTYDFRHALIRDAVYEDIGLARRRGRRGGRRVHRRRRLRPLRARWTSRRGVPARAGGGRSCDPAVGAPSSGRVARACRANDPVRVVSARARRAAPDARRRARRDR